MFWSERDIAIYPVARSEGWCGLEASITSPRGGELTPLT